MPASEVVILSVFFCLGVCFVLFCFEIALNSQSPYLDLSRSSYSGSCQSIHLGDPFQPIADCDPKVTVQPWLQPTAPEARPDLRDGGNGASTPVLEHLETSGRCTDPSRAQAAGQALHSSRCSLQRETFESKKWAKGQEEIVSEEKSPCLRQGSPRSEGGCS